MGEDYGFTKDQIKYDDSAEWGALKVTFKGGKQATFSAPTVVDAMHMAATFTGLGDDVVTEVAVSATKEIELIVKAEEAF